MKCSLDFLTFVRFTNQSDSEFLYPNGKSNTLFKPLSFKFKISSTSPGEKPSIGVESTPSNAAAIIVALKEMLAC